MHGGRARSLIRKPKDLHASLPPAQIENQLVPRDGQAEFARRQRLQRPILLKSVDLAGCADGGFAEASSFCTWIVFASAATK